MQNEGHMQNLVIATDIFPGARAFFEKSALVAGQVKHLFAQGDRIIGSIEPSIQCPWIIDRLRRQVEPAAESLGFRMGFEYKCRRIGC